MYIMHVVYTHIRLLAFTAMPSFNVNAGKVGSPRGCLHINLRDALFQLWFQLICTTLDSGTKGLCNIVLNIAHPDYNRNNLQEKIPMWNSSRYVNGDNINSIENPLTVAWMCSLINTGSDTV